MKLTGKCKVEFEEWMHPTLKSEYKYGQSLTANFDLLPDAMQYGVLVDFFLETADRYIEIYSNASGWGFMITRGGFNGTCVWEIKDYIFFGTLELARTEAILKADEIRNKQL